MNRFALLAAAALAVSACTGNTPRTPSPESAAASITSMLVASTADWNRGNLDGFLAPYLDSSETTFVTATGLVHGLGAIRDRYRARYFAAGALPPLVLRFENLQVRMLGAEHALATGRYVLTQRAGGAAAGTGNFSLVLARTPAGWKIIHDHSSGS